MKKILLPIGMILLLLTSCKKESLRPEQNQVPGTTTEQLQISPKEIQEVRSNEASLAKDSSIVFTAGNFKPAPGLQEIDWKIDYTGKLDPIEINIAYTDLVNYIIDLQDFLELYPAEKYYFLGVHKEFITKLQLSLSLKLQLEVGLQEIAKLRIVQEVFKDMDKSLQNKGMIFDFTSMPPKAVITVDQTHEAIHILIDELELYISDGLEILANANPEYSALEKMKIQLAKDELEKLKARL